MKRLLALLLALLLAGCTTTPADPTGPPAEPATEAPALEEATERRDATTPASVRDNRSRPPTPAPAKPAPADNGTENATATTGVVVAVLDNGIEPDHEAFLPGQVVAWYDFGREDRPDGVPNVTWDPAVAPYARNDHGPATASMVGGVGDHTPSFALGVSLAIGQVALNDRGGTSWRDLADAIRWAVDVVGADVISISKLAHTPQGPPTQNDRVLLDSIQYARDAGVLPVVLAGNGYGNTMDPTMSWLHAPAMSTSALVVGGARSDGTPVSPWGSMDPEVTALYDTRLACAGATDCYEEDSGTSYSTPLVAGMAARLLMDARDADTDLEADGLEALLKGCARDTAAPPTFEGHGFLDADGLACARQHLADGTAPEPDLANEVYVDVAGDAVREAWSDL